MTLEQLKTRLEIAKKREKWGVVDDVIQSLEERISDGHDQDDDLPTAAYLIEAYGELISSVAFPNKGEAESFVDDRPGREIFEVVRREDAEQAIEQAKSKYVDIANNNLGNGAKAERRRVLDLIDQRIDELTADEYPPKKIIRQNAINELGKLREEVEQSDD